jgi:class 3 adenylate cyclase
VANCGKCGAELPPRFRFCGSCGAPVEAAREREVRKVVTVLFCDASGSTALGERLDPELLRRVIRRYFEAIARVIVAHGGLVEKFAGDAVMAVFGLPQAYEDDALRAVKAAVEVRDRLPALAEETGFELAFRTGINSGEVVAGRGQTLATGDAVNVAARLEQAAQPGEILLGQEAVRLLGQAVEVEPLPPLELRGKGRPVEAFRFCSLAAAIELERSLFVGRERELALLWDAFRRSAEARELQLFTLLGPAGIGKSRLACEFGESLHGQAQVVDGRCLSYGQAITYRPLIEVLRALGEPAKLALERVVGGGATSAQELAWTVQRALEQAAEEQPLVVVLEDLHWAEPALLDLIDLVSDLSRGYPIVLLCLARPELLEEQSSWGGGKLNATSALLEPLSTHDCETLIAMRHPLDSAQRKRVVETAAGNPLFLEELTEFVAEGGDGELPPRIHALLQARLDLLPEPERLVLACASIDGTVFHRGRLQTLVPSDLSPQLPTYLAALIRKELIRPAPGEFNGEDGFRFRHQLIRDTAYGAIPKRERARLHERFADWLEEHSDARGELEEIGAYHLERAALANRELGSRDPLLDERAASALAAAAERACRSTVPAPMSAGPTRSSRRGRYGDALGLADEGERLGGADDRIALIGANTA